MPLDAAPHPTAVNSAADAAIIKGMAKRGDRQADIGAWFGLNHGRINEILKCSTVHARKFADVPPAPAHALPPPGPYSYFTVRPNASLAEQVQQALAAQDLKWSQALAIVREELRVTTTERRQTNEKLDQVLRQLATLGREWKLIETPKAPTISRRKPLGD